MTKRAVFSRSLLLFSVEKEEEEEEESSADAKDNI